jgi:hypothetical protein
MGREGTIYQRIKKSTPPPQFGNKTSRERTHGREGLNEAVPQLYNTGRHGSHCFVSRQGAVMVSCEHGMQNLSIS